MSLIDPKLEEFLFQSYTLTFTVPYTDPKVWDLVEDAPVEFEGEVFFISHMEDDHDVSGTLIRKVEAEARWMRLADINRSGDWVVTEVSVRDGLEEILRDTGWTIGQLTEDTEVYSMDATDPNVLSLIWEWARLTNNEVQFEGNNKTLHMIPQVGANLGVGFRYGRNLQSIKRTVTPPKATRIFPFGKDDLNISSISPSGRNYIEDFSFYTGQGLTLEEARADYTKDLTLSDDKITSVGGLYAWANSQLDLLSQPQVVYAAKAIDLSTVTGYASGVYRCGDTVQVEDELLNVSEQARVTRRVRYPMSPEKNEVELSFGLVQLPNGNLKTRRDSQSRNWELFQSQNREASRRVYHLRTILHRLFLRCTKDAEWVVHYQLQGVAEGNSTVTLQAIDSNHFLEDEITPVPLWTSQEITLTDGEPYDFTFSFGRQEIPAGEYELTIQAISDTPGAGLFIDVDQTAFWVLARGTTRTTKTYPNSIRFDYTGSIQTFEVPEFVSEIRVQCVAGGAQNGPDAIQGPGSGSSGSVTASIKTQEFERFDVYVGGRGYIVPFAYAGLGGGGWPDGGHGSYDVFGGNRGSGGSGSSQIRLEGAPKEEALIVAPGGGGRGAGNQYVVGGNGGFFQGNDGESLTGNQGLGASQVAGGVSLDGGGGVSPTGDGDFDGGGDGESEIFGAYWGAGGGGGGWFGGAAGGSATGAGFAGSGGGGGGGSGWVGNVFDVEVQDDFMRLDEDGYVIISWPDPDDSLALY